MNPRKSFQILALLALVLNMGCSKDYWHARLKLFQAEQIFWKANVTLKSHKVPFEERRKYYCQACDDYFGAYQLRPKIFTSMKIEEAAHSCFSCENKDTQTFFEAVQFSYCKEHPLECQYGDMPTPSWAEG